MGTVITYGLGGHDPTKPNNNIVSVEHYPDIAQPLDAAGVAATLNAVLGLWSLQDAANAVNRHPDELIAEAKAWAVASA